MSSLIKVKQVWVNPKFRAGPNYFEIRERKPTDTLAVVGLCGTTLAGLSVLFFLPFSAIDPLVLAIVLMLLLIPTVAAAAIYRPPRVLRVYPDEQLLHCFRRVFAIKLFQHWHDFSQCPLCVMHVNIQIKAPPSDQAMFVSTVLGIIGPLGFLIPLVDQLIKRSKQNLPAFAIAFETSEERPFAVFLQLDELHKLLDACGEEVNESLEMA